jgi:exopolyphosphatase/guanosine-5'-triphosphate,3'-diphosphate pyrophosphatase
MPDPTLLAAIDLGSNSFRLLIGQAAEGSGSRRVKTVESVKRSVRLAAGLDTEQRLDSESRRRGLEALTVFAERLRSYAPEAVRAVATNTLRVARNARHFLASAEAVLGVPIEVISGHEEARLIYRGAASALATDGRQRLVIDIGGGSTECIIGRDDRALLLESIDRGCVATTREYFTEGRIVRQRFEQARHHARAGFTAIVERYRECGWRHAVGTSGTAKALTQIARQQFGQSTLTRAGLEAMITALLEAGDPIQVDWAGLKPERRPVLAGGLAVMGAVFDEFGLEAIDYCAGALREGVLLELLDRRVGLDSRESTVLRLAERHQLDLAHGRVLAATALAIFDQAARADREALGEARRRLDWACRLAEIGMVISHENHHRHAAYMLEHGDLPGFSQEEQQALATLVLAQCGGLKKVRGRVRDELSWIAVLALRVASLLRRGHATGETPLPALFFRRKTVRLELPAHWLSRHPVVDETLQAEARLWVESAIVERFDCLAIAGPDRPAPAAQG